MEEVRPRNRCLLFLLLSTPAIVGAIILQFVDVFQGKAESISSTSLIVGTLSAAFFGYIAVSWMIQYLKIIP